MLDLEKRLEKLTEALAGRAIRYAEHAGRKKLIRKNDVLLVTGSDHRSANTLRRSASTTNPTSSRHR